MIVWNNEHYRLWTTEAFWFYSFPPVEEAQMNSGETSVMYESSIFNHSHEHVVTINIPQ